MYGEETMLIIRMQKISHKGKRNKESIDYIDWEASPTYRKKAKRVILDFQLKDVLEMRRNLENREYRTYVYLYDEGMEDNNYIDVTEEYLRPLIKYIRKYVPV